MVLRVRSALVLPLAALVAHFAAGCASDPVSNDYPGENDPGSGGAATVSTATSVSSSGGAATATATSSSTGAADKWSADVDNSAVSADLFDKATVSVIITPGGFSGDVTFAVSGLSTDVDASFDMATATISGSDQVIATLTINTHTDAVTGTKPFTVTVASAGKTQKLDEMLTIRPALTIHIPANVDSMSGGDSYGPNPFVISKTGISASNPVTVRFMNDDDKAHQIHAESPEFPHDDNDIPAHTMDSKIRTPYDPATYAFYLHDEGGAQNAGSVQIK